MNWTKDFPNTEGFYALKFYNNEIKFEYFHNIKNKIYGRKGDFTQYSNILFSDSKYIPNNNDWTEKLPDTKGFYFVSFDKDLTKNLIGIRYFNYYNNQLYSKFGFLSNPIYKTFLYSKNPIMEIL